MAYELSLACRNYDRTNAILRGAVKPQGIDLRLVEMTSVPRMFEGMYRGEYEASEMSLAETIYYTSRGQADFTAVPVFPSRLFRHSFIFHNTSSSVAGPESVKGARIGFPRLVQTACIWMRGILTDECGAAPETTRWFYGSVHHWDGSAHQQQDDSDAQPKDGSQWQHLETLDPDDNVSAERALEQGAIDILGSTKVPRSLGKDGGNIQRLFPDSMAAEADYFQRTGIFPIMHILAIRKSVVEAHPDIPERLFDLFVRARNSGNQWLASDPSLGLAWKNDYMERERAIFGGDPWTYGLEPNLRTIAKFLDYCYDQGVSARKMGPEELFAPSSWKLSES